MPDFNVTNYRYAGVNVISQSPFFPNISGVGANAVASFNQGYVFDYKAVSGGKLEPITVSNMDQYYTADNDFYVTMFIDTGTETVQRAYFSQGVIPSDTSPENRYLQVAKLDKGKIKEVKLRENIHWFGNSNNDSNTGSLAGEIHPWKVSPNVIVGTWDILGGRIYGKGGFIDIAANSLVASSGYIIYLEVTLSGDALVSGSFGSGATIPTNTEDKLYFEIAYIMDDANHIQFAFEPIRINDGDSFVLNVWDSTITVVGEGYSYPPWTGVSVDNGANPSATFYIQRGLWHVNEPVGFPASPTVFNITYNLPTV